MAPKQTRHYQVKIDEVASMSMSWKSSWTSAQTEDSNDARIAKVGGITVSATATTATTTDSITTAPHPS